MSDVNEIKLVVDEETVNYLESLDYEVSARRDIIAFMLANNMQTDTEAFAYYQKEYNEFSAQFQIAKSEMERKYIPEGRFNWSLNYADRMLTVTVTKGDSCGCSNK